MYFNAQILISNLTSFDLTLTWPQSKGKLHCVIGSHGHHYRYRCAKYPRKQVPHGVLVTFIFSDPLFTVVDTLTVTFLSMTFVLVQYLSLTYTRTLGEFELLATRQTDPRAQNVKLLFVSFFLLLTRP